jgi:hypothetical protein
MRVTRVAKFFTGTLLVLVLWRHAPRILLKPAQIRKPESVAYDIGFEISEEIVKAQVNVTALGYPRTLEDVEDSLTLLLPVTGESLQDLPSILGLLVAEAWPESHITVVSPEYLGQETRRIIHSAVDQLAFQHADVSLALSRNSLGPIEATLDAAYRTFTRRTLIMDERGLEGLTPSLRHIVLSPHHCGNFGSQYSSVSCLHPFGCDDPLVSLHLKHLLVAQHPLPPFTLASGYQDLIPSALKFGRENNVWETLGQLIAQRDGPDHEGFLVWNGSRGLDRVSGHSRHGMKDYLALPASPSNGITSASNTRIVFAIALLSIGRLFTFSSAICNFQSNGHQVRVLIYKKSEQLRPDIKVDSEDRTLTISSECSISYTDYSHSDEAFNWLSWQITPDVLIHDAGEDEYPELFHRFLGGVTDISTIQVYIPPADLSLTDWMGSLRKEEWKGPSNISTTSLIY